MRRRILTAILATTVVAVVLFAVPLAIMIGRASQDRSQLDLQARAISMARQVNPRQLVAEPKEVEISSTGQTQFGLYNASGDRIAGVGPKRADAVVQSALGNALTYVEQADRSETAIPVFARGRVVGALRAAGSVGYDERKELGAIAAVGALALMVLGISAAVAMVLAQRLARPIQALSAAAEQIGDGDIGVTVPQLDIPELDEVGRTLAATSARVATMLAAERAFATDASHQLRTPLAGIRTNIEAELAYPRPDKVEVLIETLADVDRLEATVTELLALSRTGTAQGRADVCAVLAELEPAWERRLSRAGRELRISCPQPPPAVRGNNLALQHALEALLDNSLVHGAGQVTVTCNVRPQAVQLVVSDEGPGFPSEPEATSAPASATGSAAPGNGRATVTPDFHGLGLALARRLVEQMPGRLTIADPGPHPQVVILMAPFPEEQQPAEGPQ